MNGQALVLCLALGLAADEAEVLKPAVARVNGEVITRAELEAVLAERREALADVYAGMDLGRRLAEERARLLQELIEQKLIMQAARRELSMLDRERISRRLDQIFKRHPEKMKQLLARVRRRPTAKTLTEEEREQLLHFLYVEEVVRRRTRFDPLRLSPKELHDYYRKHRDRFHEPETLQVRMIYVDKAFHGSDAAARKALAVIRQKLAAGTAFAPVARAHSNGPNAEDGGLWPAVRRGMLQPALDKLVFGLKVNELGGPLATPQGYFLVRLEGRTPARDIPFSDAQERIKKKIAREVVDKNLRAWVRELRKTARVEIFGPGGAR